MTLRVEINRQVNWLIGGILEQGVLQAESSWLIAVALAPVNQKIKNPAAPAPVNQKIKNPAALKHQSNAAVDI